MWRYLLLGVMVVGALVALIMFDNSWSERFATRPVVPDPVAAPVPAAVPDPVPVPLPLPPSPDPTPVPTPAPVPMPVLAPLPTVPIAARPPLVVVPPIVRRPSARVVPPEIASALDHLVAARRLLDAGQIAEARNQLAKAQLRMVLRPVTPDQPNRTDSNVGATYIGEAIRALDAGDINTAMRTINLVLANGF